MRFGPVGVRVWDTATWTQRSITPVPRDPDSVTALSADAARVAYPHADGSVSLWDVAAGRRLWRAAGHTGTIRSLAFDPGGASVASCASDGTVRVWHAADGEPMCALPVRGSVGVAPAVFPNDRLLVLPLKRPELAFLDLPTGREQLATAATAEQNETLASAVAPNGSLIATGHAGGLVIIWDIATRRPLRTLAGMDPAVWSLAFSPDATRLATGSQDRLVRIWDYLSGEELIVLRGHRGTVTALAWDPEGRRLASGSYDAGVLVWDSLEPARGR